MQVQASRSQNNETETHVSVFQSTVCRRTYRDRPISMQTYTSYILRSIITAVFYVKCFCIYLYIANKRAVFLRNASHLHGISATQHKSTPNARTDWSFCMRRDASSVAAEYKETGAGEQGEREKNQNAVPKRTGYEKSEQSIVVVTKKNDVQAKTIPKTRRRRKKKQRETKSRAVGRQKTYYWLVKEWWFHRYAGNRERAEGVYFIVMHGRSLMGIDPRIPAMPGRSTPGFHRPGSVKCEGGMDPGTD